MFYIILISLNEPRDFDIENIDVIIRALDYYSKSLKNLEENETDESIPLINGQVKESLLEVELIKEALKSGTISYLNFVRKKLNFIVSVLEFYMIELSEDLEELENTKNNDSDIDLIQKEISKVNGIIQIS